MASRVFSLLIFSGFLGISAMSREFFYVRDSKTWQEAQLYCRRTYTDLATIESMDDKKRATRKVDLLYTGDVWIGLTKVADIHWGWSMGENTLSEYNNWAEGQPDNSYLDGHCGALTKQTGYWRSRSCNQILNFVCYDELDGMFYLPFMTGTWTEAQMYCRRYLTDLASIHNPSEQSRMTRAGDTTDFLWLGLFGDTWGWSDQSSTTFRYWGFGKPLDMNLNYSNCAALDMTDSGSWTNWPCDEKLPFLCHKSTPLTRRQVVEFKIRSDGDRDLNVVKENILKQIYEKLISQGSNFSSLSWRESDGKVFKAEKNKTIGELPESCEVLPWIIDNSTES